MEQRVGGYRVLGEVGRGGIGVVYRAQGPDGRLVAVKLLLQLQPRRQARFETEARTLMRLRHPHVVAILDSGKERGIPYLVLEWVEGETLGARLERDGPLDPRQAADLVARLARALEHCHEQGVLHRDLKPDNVLLRGAELHPMLADFGLARDLETSQVGATIEGAQLGTPGWWPPEQARGELSRIGPRSDVYGLGALLYGCLTGRPPQEATSPMQALDASERLPAPPRERRPVPPRLEAICMRALAREPDARQGSAGELAAELEDWLDHPDAATAVATSWLAPTALVLTLVCVGLAVALVVVSARGQPLPAPSGPTSDPTPVASRAAPGPDSAQRRAEALELVERARAQAGRDAIQALQVVERALELAPACAEAWCLRGSIRFALQDPTHARQDLDRALELDPRLAEAWSERGSLRATAGDLPGAQRDLERAVELDPQDARTWHLLGNLHVKLGELPAAQAAYERALKLDPGRSESWGNLGRVHRALGDYDQAQLELDRAVQLDPGRSDGWLQRAQLHVQCSRWTEALADAQAAARLAPREAANWFTQGVALVGLGRLEDAVGVLERGVALDPQDASAWGNLGVAYLQLGRPEKARNALDRGLLTSPDDPDLLANRGAVRQELGDLTGALADLDHALERAPDLRQALFNRGLLQQRAGQPALAAADFERVVQLNPQDAEALVQLAALRLDAKDPAGASALLDRAEAADPREGSLFFLRGKLLAGTDPQAARAQFDRALALDPHQAECWLQRGLLRWREGDLDGAVADLERSRAESPALIPALGHLASLLAERGEHARALQLLGQAVEVTPRDPQLWDVRGLVKIELDDLAGAIQDANRSIELAPRRWRAWYARGQARARCGDYAGELYDFSWCQALLGPDDPLWADFERRLTELRSGRF